MDTTSFRSNRMCVLLIAALAWGAIATWSQPLLASAPPACEKGSLYDYKTQACLPVVDIREELPRLELGGQTPPNLATMRKQQHGTQMPGFNRKRMRKPGGIGAGTLFNIGALPASGDTYLETYMGIYPGGLSNVSNWIYTTSTNRTEKGTETLGAYLGSTADFDVFDWSCSATDPCPLAKTHPTSPDWVVIIPLSNLNDGCHYVSVLDDSNILRTALQYRNETIMNGTWNENWVYLWNTCSSSWEGVYAHGYSGEQADCSLGQSCGWWGPIIETFGDTPSTVPALTFFGASLYTGGTLYLLTDAYTNWVPPVDPWTTFSRRPNFQWAVGGQLQ
jgi:hypothetical protein